MANARYLDHEVAPGERPQRPAVLPPEAPDTQVMPDAPLTPGERQALEQERAGQQRGELEGRVPEGGLPDGIPHGEEGPGAKPPPTCPASIVPAFSP